MTGLTRPTPPTGGRTLGDEHSALTKRLIADGLPKGQSEIERLRADLHRMEALMIRWRIAAQRWTPGGSEYMDPAYCEEFIRARREDHVKTKVENVRLRKLLAEAGIDVDRAA